MSPLSGYYMPPCPICGEPLPWMWQARGRKRKTVIVQPCKCVLTEKQVVEAARLVNEKTRGKL